MPLHGSGLGSSLFARRYWGSRGFFLFLRVLRCFSSPGSPPAPMHSAQAGTAPPCRVAPFGHLRITSCLALPRSLSQPRHVLHRFLPPRHPPHTLSSLTVLTRRHVMSTRPCTMHRNYGDALSTMCSYSICQRTPATPSAMPEHAQSAPKRRAHKAP